MKGIFSLLLVFVASSPAYSADCQKTYVQEPTPFLGNGGEIIILGDGSVWKEVSYQYLYLYEYNPQVIVCTDGKMFLGEYELMLIPVE